MLNRLQVCCVEQSMLPTSFLSKGEENTWKIFRSWSTYPKQNWQSSLTSSKKKSTSEDRPYTKKENPEDMYSLSKKESLSWRRNLKSRIKFRLITLNFCLSFLITKPKTGKKEFWHWVTRSTQDQWINQFIDLILSFKENKVKMPWQCQILT